MDHVSRNVRTSFTPNRLRRRAPQLVFAVALALGAATSAQADPIAPSAIRITDGDTIRAHGHAYRLVGFDTPEINSRRREVCDRERELGRRAKERLAQIISAGGLDLVEVR